MNALEHQLHCCSKVDTCAEIKFDGCEYHIHLFFDGFYTETPNGRIDNGSIVHVLHTRHTKSVQFTYNGIYSEPI